MGGLAIIGDSLLFIVFFACAHCCLLVVTICALCVHHCLFTLCSHSVHDLFAICSLFLHDGFLVFSVYMRSLFDRLVLTVCSLLITTVRMSLYVLVDDFEAAFRAGQLHALFAETQRRNEPV